MHCSINRYQVAIKPLALKKQLLSSSDQTAVAASGMSHRIRSEVCPHAAAQHVGNKPGSTMHVLPNVNMIM